MKLITLQCPSCGSSLNVEEGRNTYFCSYCRQQILLDDEAQHVKVSFENAEESGYEFEKGRMSARSEGADPKLISSIKCIADALPQLDSLKAQSSGYFNEIKNYESKLSTLSQPVAQNKHIIWSAGLAVLAIILLIGDAGVPIFLILLACAVGAFFFLQKKYQDDLTNTKKALDSANASYKHVQGEMERIHNKCDFSILPDEYLTADAAAFIYKALTNRRAINIQQAINLYEDHQHQQRLESMQREQLELQRQQRAEPVVIEKTVDNKSGRTIGDALVTGIGIAAGASVIKDIIDDLKP